MQQGKRSILFFPFVSSRFALPPHLPKHCQNPKPNAIHTSYDEKPGDDEKPGSRAQQATHLLATLLGTGVEYGGLAPHAPRWDRGRVDPAPLLL